MINISYLPNIGRDDFLETLKIFLQPLFWTKGKYELKVKRKIKRMLKAKRVYLFNSGRGGLAAIFKNIDLRRGDEVIVQAFTCCAVVNPVLSAGGKVVYVDINDEYNLNIKDLKKKITKKTKAIIVQHTFGIPAKIEEIINIAKKNNLVVIEDLAHGFGGEYKGKKIGTYGDYALISFGRSKAVSAVFGGAVVINKDTRVGKMRRIFRSTFYPPFLWTGKQLWHQIIFYIVGPFYNFLNIGKIFLYGLSKINLLSREVEDIEKKGKMSEKMIFRMPNALCFLALNQLRKMKFFKRRRKKISRMYQKKLNKEKYKFLDLDLDYLRFPVEVKKKRKILKMAKRKGIYLGDWYSYVVAPKGVNLRKIGYEKGECKRAEEKNKVIINLPTNPYLKEEKIKKVIAFLNGLEA